MSSSSSGTTITKGVIVGGGRIGNIISDLKKSTESFKESTQATMDAFSMFKPFVPQRGGTEAEKVPEPAPDDGNIDDLRRQMKDMQERLERMSQPAKKDE
jgi:polyhydroxyalkanoate synthesis regulator protein